ncbi:MAG: hypothetical protein QM726_23080 [Chitinophagaceae bacterium]
MQVIQELETDFKAEVIAVSLLGHKQDFGSIIFDRLGNRARGHTKDAYHIADWLGGATDKVAIQSFRQSMYDAMPENFFHPVTLGGVGKSNDDIIHEIRHQRKIEQDARKFFKPFEQEASYIEMQSLLLELMYEQKATFSNLLDLFKQTWPILGRLPSSVALSFIYILPILHEVRGDIKWIERCLLFVTGFDVRIEENNSLNKIDTSLPSFTTGNSLLGINSSLAGNQYDGIAGWDIHIGPVPQSSVADVLPHSGFIELMQLLADHFVPSGIFINFIIHPEKGTDTVLSPEADGPCLGYSFFL